ncbi:MAG TPA: PIG-L deacetylase family protein [Anaerolineales bacterium]|nr:PIG-L deacetylase family protein [Anaerolineales bacterium]
MPGKILIFSPHPDDAEFFAGGTIARMTAEGAEAIIVVVSDGRRGSFEHDSESLARVRREEAARGAAALGAGGPIWLGYPDLELDTLTPGTLREQFIRLIRQHRPGVVIAQDAFSLSEVHPDHRAVALAASDAVSFASLPLLHPEHREEGLEPHLVVEKYFYAPAPSAVNKIVDITETMERKLAAMGEHRTQVAFLVEDVMRQARLAGIDIQTTLGEAAQDSMAALAWAIRAEAAEVGARAGVNYGEAFRYVRFHPLVESLLVSGGVASGGP